MNEEMHFSLIGLEVRSTSCSKVDELSIYCSIIYYSIIKMFIMVGLADF